MMCKPMSKTNVKQFYLKTILENLAFFMKNIRLKNVGILSKGVFYRTILVGKLYSNGNFIGKFQW